MGTFLQCPDIPQIIFHDLGCTRQGSAKQTTYNFGYSKAATVPAVGLASLPVHQHSASICAPDNDAPLKQTIANGDGKRITAVDGIAPPDGMSEMQPNCARPPWTAELTPNCFIVRDANGQALSYIY